MPSPETVVNVLVSVWQGIEPSSYTCRYARSFLAAEKLRDAQWWDATLAGFQIPEPMEFRPQSLTAPSTIPSVTRQHPTTPAATTRLPSPPLATQDLTVSQSAPSPLTTSPGMDSTPMPRGGNQQLLRSASAREDAELNQRVLAERRGLPTTIDGFKSHPLYILERHIGRYQGLKPSARKAGLHRYHFYP